MRPTRPSDVRSLRPVLFALMTSACLICAPRSAHTHGGDPRVAAIRFEPGRPGPWLIDNLGLLESRGGQFHWLCDDAVNLLAGFDDVVALDASTWLVSTRAGIYRTEDAGCRFTRLEGALADHVTGRFHPHPGRREELVLGTQTLGLRNDVYRTTDGGRSWHAAGLSVEGRVRSLLRSPSNPDRLWAVTGSGGLRSDDGGQTFQPIPLGPAAVDPQGSEVALLGADPLDPDVVLAVVERFPDSTLIRSADGGLTWTAALVIDDAPESLVLLHRPDPREDAIGLLSTPFRGLFRSVDGGRSWRPLPSEWPALGCLTQEPGSGRVWACGRGRPAPVVAVSSGDAGERWQTHLASYLDVAGGWGCPADSPTGRTCGAQCSPADLICAQSDAGQPTPPVGDAGPANEAGIADGSTPGRPEPADARPGDGAAPDPGDPSERRPQSSGCAAAPGSSSRGADPDRGDPGPWMLALLAAAWAGRRRVVHRPH